MEDDTEGVARAAMHTADAVTKVDAIVAARTFYRAVPRGEDDGLPLIRGDYFGFGLCARLLLHQNEFAAIPVAALLTEKKNHLHRESHFAVKILMQAVVTACLIMQH